MSAYQKPTDDGVASRRLAASDVTITFNDDQAIPLTLTVQGKREFLSLDALTELVEALMGAGRAILAAKKRADQ